VVGGGGPGAIPPHDGFSAQLGDHLNNNSNNNNNPVVYSLDSTM